MHQVLEEQRMAKADSEVLGHVRNAQSADIGEYISLKLLPAVIYITIRKGVQLTALQILARQILEHSRTDATRILLQHKPKTGRFAYHTWLTSRTMKDMDETALYNKILTITKQGKRTQTLVIRQNIRRGRIHDLWNTNFSLL